MSRPIVFEHKFVVSPSDIDQLGHVNNVVYLRYAQDAAVAHWHAAVRLGTPAESRVGRPPP